MSRVADIGGAPMEEAEKGSGPSAHTIRATYRRFLKTGSVHDRQRPGLHGRPNPKGDQIVQFFNEIPKTSIRTAANQLEVHGQRSLTVGMPYTHSI